jgi:hypothetical protein
MTELRPELESLAFHRLASALKYGHTVQPRRQTERFIWIAEEWPKFGGMMFATI